MDRQKFAVISASVLVATALYATWLWQPARQVHLHTMHFLKAVERRNWDTAQGFLAENYADRWGHDKENVFREAREVFRQFLFLTIQGDAAPATLRGCEAEIHVSAKVAGQGGPLVDFVIEKVNTLRAPFAFSWTRRSWKPWDWQLVRIDQPELEIESGRAF